MENNSGTKSNPNEELQKALGIAGYIKKKSPNILKGFQKRYFIISEQEETYLFAWFLTQEDRKPQGNLDFSQFLSIKKIGERNFAIQYPGREFEFKVKSGEIRDNWVKNLQIIMDNVENKNPQKLQRTASSGNYGDWKKFTDRSLSSISFDKEVKMMNEGGKRGSIRQSSVNTIQLQKRMSSDSEEIGSVLGAKKNQSEEVSIVKREGKLVPVEEVYEQIGLKKYMDQFGNQEFAKNRAIYGYLYKRSKGKIKYFMTRFFLLVSSKSLNPHYCDEELLDVKDLPHWLELDTLYYYKIKNKDEIGEPKGQINMKDCIEIFEKDMSTSKEQGFTFRINCGDRIFHVMVESSYDRKNWITALRKSVETSKEMNSGISVVKNIDKICQIYDYKDLEEKETDQEEKKKKLKEKIKADYILLACLAKTPKRQDIIKEYIDYLHSEILCDDISNYWDKNYEALSANEMVILADWLLSYSEKLKQFFKDERLRQGALMLFKTYRMQTVQGSKEVIDGIIGYEKTNTEHQSNDQGLVTSTAPLDLFKIVNTGYDILRSQCRYKESGICLAEQARELIEYYQDSLSDILFECDLVLTQEICICNNIIQFTNLIDQLQQKLEKDCQLSKEECTEYLDGGSLKQQFIRLSDESHCLVFNHLFSKISSYFQKKNFLEVNLEDVLQKILEEAAPQVRKLHDRFARKIWKDFLGYLSLIYFQSMICSCLKSKPDHLKEFKQKIVEDCDFLREFFEDFLFESVLNKCLETFVNMKLFLQARESEQVVTYCIKLRESFGSSFTMKTLKTLMQIRHDLEKSEIMSFLEQCQEEMDKYNQEHEQDNKEEQSQNFMELGNVKLEGGNENENGGGNQGQNQENQENQDQMVINIDSNRFVRKKTITSRNRGASGAVKNLFAGLIKNINNKEAEQKRQKEEEQYFEQGYLEKKKRAKVFIKHYYRVKNGFFYEYQNERSQYCDQKIEMAKIEKEILSVENKRTFTIVFENVKKKVESIKFRAESVQQRDTWVASLKHYINLVLNPQLNAPSQKVIELDSLKPFLKDHFEIKRKQREMEAKLERERKMKELIEQKELKDKQRNQKQGEILQFEISQGKNKNTSKTARQQSTFKINLEEQEEVKEEGEQISCLYRGDMRVNYKVIEFTVLLLFQ
ncbi:hypothetical protein PPERSA_10362 [Pseudocohnilembus persalinus]|uniref:PH domain-containing protein n=1 Tax=Pseudocohnilembus persalinus TaxID=266149 RepID=A0A0V0QN31_PSEPJ|nr:hypothetical protein PPERSA_10362 [Pseudocohnilembus persalinus]|eukprot:KRX03678.1 hypothetical protein PPERSA_10362 [Pseudocohnilembus persalinus]